MIKVYQDKTVKNDGHGNCFNASVASIMELPLRSVCQALPRGEGCWIGQWRVWLADKGFKLSMHSPLDPPSGYSIATVYTDRMYPADHPTKANTQIAHACVAFDGVIVHDPYPLGSNEVEIKYYTELKPLNDAEKLIHQKRVEGGKCIHGYRSTCSDCNQMDASC